MGCGCNKGKTTQAATSAARPDTRVQYEVFGGSLDEPQIFPALSEARKLAADSGARVRSTVVRMATEPEPVPV